MMDFEYFIKKGNVFRREKDLQLAQSLIEDAIDRIKTAKEDVSRKPKYAFENAYEAIIVLIDALFYIEGYKSYSHEANISFLSRFSKFTTVEIENLDRLRKERHGSKYYAEKINYEEAKESIEYLDKLFEKILILVKIKKQKVAE